MLTRRNPRAVMAVVAAALAMSVDAASPDAPKRRPGLWQQTVTTTGAAVPPQSMSICTDEKTDELIAARAGESKDCQQQSVRKEGAVFVVEAQCRSGNTTIRTQGRFSGDFSSRYSGELRSTFEPPLQGMKEILQTIDARWAGPCQPGQKPGDVVMEGMGGMNMKEMMQADPQKMREMMQQMQQMQKGAPR